jgi:hypothetical protein
MHPLLKHGPSPVAVFEEFIGYPRLAVNAIGLTVVDFAVLIEAFVAPHLFDDLLEGWGRCIREADWKERIQADRETKKEDE